jgi:hypothetical protein
VTTTPGRPEYKGAPLDAARGPGLGCFWLQVVLLVVLVVLTPIGVGQGWPITVTGSLLVATLVLLFFAGQTMIFLLRLVAADRRTRRRPLRSGTKTVGELEGEAASQEDEAASQREEAASQGAEAASHEEKEAASEEEAASQHEDARAAEATSATEPPRSRDGVRE